MMLPVEALTYAVVMAAACSYLIWLLPGKCQCEKCAFHVNETRMEKVKAAELAHDYEHKGMGFTQMSPDRADCADVACVRNKSGKIDT